MRTVGVAQLLAVCAGLLFTQGLLFGAEQSTPSAPESPSPPFRFQAKVKGVLVPTLVLDRHGQAIGGLQSRDFQIFDNGKKQVITGFTVQTRLGAGTTSTVATPGIETSAQFSRGTPVEDSRVSRRYIALLFDDLHLSGSNLVQVQKAAKQMLAKSLNSADLAAVLSTSGRVNTGFTHDQAKLQQGIANLRQVRPYSHPLSECPDIDHYEAYLILQVHDPQALHVVATGGARCPGFLNGPKDFNEGVAKAAAEWEMPRGEQATYFTLEVIRQIVRQMGNLAGQRTLILISPGFIALTPTAANLRSRVIDTAAQANVTISALDARGLYTEMEDENKRLESQVLNQFMREDNLAFGAVMSQLTSSTGGTYYHDANDFEGGLASLFVPPEYLYLLQFSPNGTKQDGTFHVLKVKVNFKGAKVHARPGYFAGEPRQSKSK